MKDKKEDYHKILNYINNIKSSCQILNEEICGPLSDEQKMLIKKIETNVDKLWKWIIEKKK